jgi:excinuclease UvrABC helicase subunit UvrB
LLGLLHDETSLACRALVGLGVDLGQVRADVLSRLPPGPAADIARQKSLEELFQDHPRVQELKQRIAQLQLALEEAVKVQDFILAASYRDQRRAVERTLDDLYNELGQG